MPINSIQRLIQQRHSLQSKPKRMDLIDPKIFKWGNVFPMSSIQIVALINKISTGGPAMSQFCSGWAWFASDFRDDFELSWHTQNRRVMWPIGGKIENCASQWERAARRRLQRTCPRRNLVQFQIREIGWIGYVCIQTCRFRYVQFESILVKILAKFGAKCELKGG